VCPLWLLIPTVVVLVFVLEASVERMMMSVLIVDLNSLKKLTILLLVRCFFWNGRLERLKEMLSGYSDCGKVNLMIWW